MITQNESGKKISITLSSISAMEEKNNDLFQDIYWMMDEDC